MAQKPFKTQMLRKKRLVVSLVTPKQLFGHGSRALHFQYFEKSDTLRNDVDIVCVNILEL